MPRLAQIRHPQAPCAKLALAADAPSPDPPPHLPCPPLARIPLAPPRRHRPLSPALPHRRHRPRHGLPSHRPSSISRHHPQAETPRTAILFHLLTTAHIPRPYWLAAVLLILLAATALVAQLNAALSTLTFSIVLPLRQRLATDIYRAILHADWHWLTRRRASTLTHYLTAELNRTGILAGNLIAILSNAMVALIMLALAAWLAPVLTLLLLAAFALLLPFQRRSARALYASGTQISLATRDIFDSAVERLGNLKVVKAFGAEDTELALFTRRYQSALQSLIQSQWRTIASARRFQLLSLVLLAALILFGLTTLHLPPASLLVFLFAFMRATPRINTIQSKLGEVLTDLPAFTDIQTFLSECSQHTQITPATIRVPQVSHLRPGFGAPQSLPDTTLTTALTLTDITFAYTPGTPVLANLSLTIPANRITAIAGLSGAGKSTLADIILGLLTPHSGTITADATPITPTNAAAWRTRIGYVSQDTHLFHATIRENLLWALPSATEAQLQQALAEANATFVATLPQGLETQTGDRGLMLSHGQRQRIALARALLLRPTLLILDEATNSLDLENEATILATVASLNITTLLISHRPSALAVAHRVHTLESGTLT